MKLHLGCGTKHIEGYTNIDIRYLPGVDEVIKFMDNFGFKKAEMLDENNHPTVHQQDILFIRK
jgi:hypothetical protein